MSKPLQNQENAAKIEQPAKVLATPDGPNRNLMLGASRMADYGYYPDSIGEINPEQKETWQPVGAVIARLIGGAK